MHQQQTSTPGNRSPSRYGKTSNIKTRVDEKEELCGLNDRLATYIDRMRYLEQQNSRLTAEITTSKESVSREVGNVKSMYEAELADARKLIDENVTERAIVQLENQKLSSLTEDLHQKLDKEMKLRIRVQDELKRTERRLHEKESLLAIVSKERKQLDERVKELEAEVKRLEDEVNKQRKLLENEIIRRVSAENKVQTLEDQAAFNAHTHAEKLNELRTSAESYKISFETTDGPREYDSLIRDKLQELREEFEDEAEKARQELEGAYKGKFDESRRSTKKDRDEITRLYENNSDMKSELEKLISNYNMLEAKNEQLQRRVAELDNMRVIEKEDFKRQMNDRDDRIRELQNRLEKLETEYEALLGIKIALDIEIAAYRKMLEGEEERLSMPTSTSEIRSTSIRKSENKRMRGEDLSEIENIASGSIEVEECDPLGRFVKLKNNSQDDEPLGGWFVQRIVDGKDEESIEYRFTPKYVLKAAQSVTIWSQSAGVKQKAPTDLVLKIGNWNNGINMVTSVMNSDNEMLAKQTMKVSETYATSPRRSRKRRTGEDRESCAMM